MLKHLLVFTVCVLSFAGKADELGKKAYATCIACHGSQGEGNSALNAPALAGQQSWYLIRQLNHFKNAIRGAHAEDTFGAQMVTMSAVLTNKETIQAVAQYIEGFPLPTVTAEDVDIKNGGIIYRGNCGACHGQKAEGNEAFQAPALAWLDKPYLQRQMKNFQKRIRGYHKKDKYGRQMALMANTVRDEKDLNDVIGFIHSLAK